MNSVNFQVNPGHLSPGYRFSISPDKVKYFTLREDVRPPRLPGQRHALIFTSIEFTGIEDAPPGAVDFPWLLRALRALWPWMVNRGHHRRRHRHYHGNIGDWPHGSSQGSSPSCNTFVPKKHWPTVSDPTDSSTAAGEAATWCAQRNLTLLTDGISLTKFLLFPLGSSKSHRAI